LRLHHADRHAGAIVAIIPDLRESAPAVGRASIIGFIFGIIPGVNHVVSTFVSYAVEKRFSKHPEQFGKGAIAGVAGPETANNAVTGTAMIPLLALGIPLIPATAILISALTIHGVQPGPLLLTDHPEVFWGLVASMYIGNVILLILNLPLVGIFVNLLRITYTWLVPIILIISIIGVYDVNFSKRRHLDHDDLRCCRLCPEKVRLRDGAASARARAGRSIGGEFMRRATPDRAALAEMKKPLSRRPSALFARRERYKR
jgi:TctA family transporter